MSTLSAIDAATQRLLAEQLCAQFAKQALPDDGAAQQYSQLFSQVLADAIGGDAPKTTT